MDVVTLGSVPNKVGLFGRRKDAAASRVLQGRDSRSIIFLVPDVRFVDQNFHDVTIVDMDAAAMILESWTFCVLQNSCCAVVFYLCIGQWRVPRHGVPCGKAPTGLWSI